jgi:hypothetical protein
MMTCEAIRTAVRGHGRVRRQSPREWLGRVPLPDRLADFYLDVGPDDVTIPGFGNDYQIPSLANLWSFQVGYRFNPQGTMLQGWDPEWLVVAAAGGDPFIFDNSSGKILYDFVGQDGWYPKPAFDDVGTMALCLAESGFVIATAGDDFCDSAGDIKLKYVEMLAGSFRKMDVDVDRVLVALGWT